MTEHCPPTGLGMKVEEESAENPIDPDPDFDSDFDPDEKNFLAMGSMFDLFW